jgi:hypothetical protein
MVKSVTAALGALLAVGGVVAVASSADAHYRHGGCCGPIPPVYSHSVVNVVHHETEYRDRWHKHYVHRVKLYVHTTEYRPIYDIHVVTRIHDQTVAVVHPRHETRTTWLAPERNYTYSTEHINEGCVCCWK